MIDKRFAQLDEHCLTNTTIKKIYDFNRLTICEAMLLIKTSWIESTDKKLINAELALLFNETCKNIYIGCISDGRFVTRAINGNVFRICNSSNKAVQFPPLRETLFQITIYIYI